MRSAVPLLVVGLVLPGMLPVTVAAPPRPLHVTDHRLEVRLDPPAGTLAGTARLELDGELGRGPRVLFLGGTCSLLSVEAVTGERARPLKFRQDATDEGGGGSSRAGWALRVPGRARRARSLRVRWRCRPGPIPENVRFSHEEIAGMPAGYLDESGSFLQAGSVWYPTGGQQLSRFHLAVTVPGDWRAVSEGNLAGEQETGGRRVERWEAGHPLEGIDLVAAPFHVLHHPAGDRVPVETWFLPGTPDDLARRYLSATARYLARYEQEIGPHAWPAFRVVEHVLPTGYGMPSFTLLGRGVIRLPFILRTSLGHEVLHDWWGNGVYVDMDRGNWCEGLTVYLADHAFAGEERPGGDVEYRRQILRDYGEYVPEKDEPPVAAFRERTDRKTRALGYGKVAMIFHMLRRIVGDRPFRGALREFYRANRYRVASWDDIRRAFEKATRNHLEWFFQQWVERPGAPRLKVLEARAERRGPEWVVRARVATGDWRLRVPADIVLEDGRRERMIAWSRGGTCRFERRVSSRPLELVVDPDVDVFRRLAPAEIPATFARLLAGDPDLVVLGTGRGGDALDAARALAQEVSRGRAPVRLDREVTDRELADARRVWVLGMPGPALLERLRARLPGSLVLERDRLGLGGREVRGPGAAIAVVIDHPAPGEGSLGILDTLVPANLADLARRVTHYGKYSRLLFEGHRAVVKATAPAPEEPLRVRLDAGEGR